MPIADWIAKKARGWQAPMIERLVELAMDAAPDAVVSIKWGQPVFEDHGPFAFIKAAKAHVTFGFWRGAELDDATGILEGGATMKHVKVKSPESFVAKPLAAMIRQAVALNRAKGDPTKRH
jgi:hypothetical protein